MTTAEFPLVVFDDAARKRFTPRNIPNLALWLDSSIGVKTGGAGQFTAANSEYLSIADNASLSVDGSTFSVACFFYADSLATQRTLLCKFKTGSDGEFWLKVDDSDTSALRFIVYNGSTSSAVSTPTATIATGGFYFVVAWLDSDLIPRISVNGVVTEGVAPLATAIAASDAPFTIGARNTGSNLWDGRISRALLAKRVWTSAERTWLFNSNAGRTYEEFGNASNDGANLLTNLVSYWKLGEVSGTRNDSHGTNHLTDNNTVTWNPGPSLIDAYEGSVVRQWNDRSGSGANVDQATVANMPLFKVGIQNGRPTVRFDGSNDFMGNVSAGGVTGNADHTMILACIPITITAGFKGILTCGYSAGSGTRISSTIGEQNTGKNWYGGDDLVTPIGGDMAASPVIYAKKHASGVTQGYKNGATDGSTQSNTYALANAGVLVGVYASDAGAMNVDVMEALIYSRALTAAEMAQAARYLSRKYAIGLAA